MMDDRNPRELIGETKQDQGTLSSMRVHEVRPEPRSKQVERRLPWRHTFERELGPEQNQTGADGMRSAWRPAAHPRGADWCRPKLLFGQRTGPKPRAPNVQSFDHPSCEELGRGSLVVMVVESGWPRGGRFSKQSWRDRPKGQRKRVRGTCH